MTFAGLSDRYNKTYSDLYNKAPKREVGQDEPYLVFRPDDPNKLETESDTQSVFPGTASREITRLSRYLKSTRGLNFLVKQAELQSGNTFSETRIFNPAFIASGIVPFTHIARPFTVASDIDLTDDNHTRSDGANDVIRSAGRLQQSTKSSVISNVLGSTGPTGLLNVFPNNPISRIASGFLNALSNDGVLAVDDRPEIDFNGEFFSVAVWRGFHSNGQVGSSLGRAASQLRKGDLFGAIKSIEEGFNKVIRGTDGTSNIDALGTNNRGDPNNLSLSGRRYFVVNGNDATAVDRYLKDSVIYDPSDTGIAGGYNSHPRANLGIWNVQVDAISRSTDGATSDFQSASNTITKATHDVDSFINGIRKIGGILFGGNAAQANPIPKLIPNNIAAVSNTELNIGRAHMIYPDLSLQSRYEAIGADDDVTKNILNQDQIPTWKLTYGADRATSRIGRNVSSNGDSRVYGSGWLAGFAGGLQPGDSIDAGSERSLDSAFVASKGGSYISDPMNLILPIMDNADTEVSSDTLNQLDQQAGNLIDFLFFDYNNQKILPFRAFLSDINESITPNVSEQQYIGRIERNIIYTGVLREVSFKFRIQAFSKAELINIWSKINYLTGLAYPSKYSDGFLIPPLVKLTIGSIYKDQPGYFKSLSYEWDTDDFEIDAGYQAAKGVNVSVSFNMIEKKQMQTSSEFYPVIGARQQNIPATVSDRPTFSADAVTKPVETAIAQATSDVNNFFNNFGSFG